MLLDELEAALHARDRRYEMRHEIVPDGLAGRLAALRITRPGLSVNFRAAPITVRRKANGDWDRTVEGYGQPGLMLTLHERSLTSEDAGVSIALVGNVADGLRQLESWARYEDDFAVEPPIAGALEARATYLRTLASARRDSTTTVRIESDLDVDVRAVAWHFPRTKRGALEPRARVLLCPLDESVDLRTRSRWVIAEGPPSARSPVEIRIHESEVVPRHERHVWSGLPWLWSPRSKGVPLRDRWLGKDHDLAEATHAAIDAGDLTTAFRQAGVPIDGWIERLLGGVPASYGFRELSSSWSTRCADAFVNAAPWRLRDVMESFRSRRPARLISFGGRGIRKPGISLCRSKESSTLRIEFSGARISVPESLWVRDPDYDLVRLGLIGVEEIPNAVSWPTSPLRL